MSTPAISMHSASAPIFARTLGNMLNWFDKAEAHAAARKFDPTVLLAARLAPDMLPFTKQVQIACDSAKFGIARLAGVEAPKLEDNEASFADLRSRVRKTIDYVNSVPAAQIDGSEGREVLVPTRSGEPNKFTGEAYLKHFVLPNLYFHATTTYALLRHAGVELGKKDFLGAA
jgi:hypothetical protein